MLSLNFNNAAILNDTSVSVKNGIWFIDYNEINNRITDITLWYSDSFKPDKFSNWVPLPIIISTPDKKYTISGIDNSIDYRVGDGSYKTQGIFNEDGECIGLRTVFIEDDYDDDEDDWWNKEEPEYDDSDDEDDSEDDK